MSLRVIWQYMDLRSFGPYNICLVTDRSIYCHMTLSAMNYLLYISTNGFFSLLYVMYIQIRLFTFKIKITLEIVVIKFHIFRSIIGLPCSFFIEANLLSVLYCICKYLHLYNQYIFYAIEIFKQLKKKA
jgi:hypothetical protein